MHRTVSLLPIELDGSPRGCTGSLPKVTGGVFRATVELYTSVGFK